jgi:uncharacterized membrane protein
MSKKMRSKKTMSAQEKEAAKKAAVLQTAKKSPLPLMIVLSCSVLLLLSGFIFFGRSGKEPLQVTSSREVSYPLQLFEDGKAHYFQLRDANGITIKYFALKSSDGVIRAAFDACDVCWPEGKGYHQDGDYMVCRNCGQRFASVKVNEVKGGCNPAPLKRQVVDGKLVIQTQDILGGRTYFDFSKRS